MKKCILSLMTLALFASCGDGGDSIDDSAKARRYEKNQQLRSQYEAVVGQYKGTIVTQPGRDPIESDISFYIIESESGVDPDTGEPLSVVELRGYLRLLDQVNELDDTVLTLSQFSNNVLRMSAQQGAGGKKPNEGGQGGSEDGGSGNSNPYAGCPMGPPDSSLSIVAKVNAKDIDLTIYRLGGTWGRMTAVRVAAEPVAPGNDPQSRWERFEKAYKPLVGTYEACLENPQPRECLGACDKDPGVRLTLQLTEYSKNGVTCPALTGTYIRTDLLPEAGGRRVVAAYIPSSHRFVMQSYAKLWGGGAATDVYSTKGEFVPDQKMLKVQISDFAGYLGDLVAVNGSSKKLKPRCVKPLRH